MSDDDLVTCEACGQPKLEKLISGGGGFVLKGSGWYRDLYASAPPPPTDSGKPPEAKSETKSEGKVDAATEAKNKAEIAQWSDTRTVSEAAKSGSGGGESSGGGSSSSGGGSSGGGSSGSSGGGSSASARSE
jgi:predicted nucleic acid-binding Zn ribbon protein